MFLITLLIGLATVPAIALSPLLARRLGVTRSPRLGTGFVLGAVGLALICVAEPERNPGNWLFLAVFVLLAVGALLLAGDQPDDPPEGFADEPPWWPEFEAEFRRYARRRRLPLPSR
jgi:hypothetical protein